MREQVFHISNLETKEEADKITQALLHVWGISQAETSAQHKTVSIKYDERMASSEDFEQVVKEVGFNLISD
ncbi:cation transporter [Bacillus sp. JJ1609]|uniref:heavy-metal-associated domain-containing protein n=1 Tax=Bacillus sp. JJ1609 TaxID=3122977 RepID=UPI002FFF5D64